MNAQPDTDDAKENGSGEDISCRAVYFKKKRTGPVERSEMTKWEWVKSRGDGSAWDFDAR